MTAVDTNVLVYSLDATEPVKQPKATALLQQLTSGRTQPILLWQVLAETVRQLRTWHANGRMRWDEVLGHLAHIRSMFLLVMPTPNVLDIALDLSSRYSLSHWDSMILGACKDAGITTLYTEDIGAPTSYDGIQLINPF